MVKAMARTSTHAGSVAAPTIGLNDRVGVQQGWQGWSPPLDQPKAPRIDRRGTVEEARSRWRGRRSVPGSGGVAISRCCCRAWTPGCALPGRGLLGRLMVPFVLRILFYRVLTTGTPMGRRARPKTLRRGESLARTEPTDLGMAGLERVRCVVGADPRCRAGCGPDRRCDRHRRPQRLRRRRPGSGQRGRGPGGPGSPR
jgi:hypothetical protein